MNATTAALAVPFHGVELFVIEHNGQPYTPMKSIAEGMGLSWQGQHEKLSANPKRWGIKKILIPTFGDMQEAICLPLRKLAGWLATISPNKVKPEIRENVIRYQNECDDALWDYWTKGQATRPEPQNVLKELPPPKTHKALPGCLTIEQQDAIKAMVRAKADTVADPKQRGTVTAGMWTALNNGLGTRGMKDGYKNIPAEQFSEALSIIARFPLQGELLPSSQSISAPDPSPKGSHGPDYALAKDRLAYLRSFAERGFPPDTRALFETALDELDRCLVRGWTEIDEAMLNFSIGMAFLRRWKGTH